MSRLPTLGSVTKPLVTSYSSRQLLTATVVRSTESSAATSNTLITQTPVPLPTSQEYYSAQLPTTLA
jgi:hypothetical protein